MPLHYNTSTETMRSVNVVATGVNAYSVDAEEVIAESVIATTVSGQNSQIAGDIHTLGGDVVVAASGQGLVLRADNGTYWRVQVDLTGNLTTTAL